MSEEPAESSGTKAALGAVARWMGPALLLLPASLLIGPIDLEGGLALAAYVVSETGGVFGLPWVALAMTAVIASMPGRTRRGLWGLSIFAVLLALLGGVSALNEFWTKRRFAIPRPNIVELSEAKVLAMTPEDFYREPDKERRRQVLEAALVIPARPGPRLHPWILNHWSREAGFSFPSGHSLAAFLFASIFVGLGRGYASGWRRGLTLALAPWAAAVAFSRVLLRVHSPTDIMVGGALGFVLALLGLLILGGAPGAKKAE